MKCLNNLHQIGLGMHMYMNDHWGHFPWTYHADNSAAQDGSADSESWIVTVGRYCEDVDDIRLCPDDPLEEDRVDPNASGIRGTSYVINDVVAPDPHYALPPDALVNLNQIKSTSTLIIMFEGANTGRAVTDDHVHTELWYAPGDIARGRVWNQILAEINPTQHVDCSNYLYADGHATTVPFSTFSSWVATDVANGTNFARPAQ